MPVAKCQLLHIVFVAFELRSKQLVVSIAQYVYEDQSDQKKRKEIRLNGVTNCPWLLGSFLDGSISWDDDIKMI